MCVCVCVCVCFCVCVFVCCVTRYLYIRMHEVFFNCIYLDNYTLFNRTKYINIFDI